MPRPVLGEGRLRVGQADMGESRGRRHIHPEPVGEPRSAVRGCGRIERVAGRVALHGRTRRGGGDEFIDRGGDDDVVL